MEQGWYPDPQNPALVRWWDGSAWTAQTQPNPNAPQQAPQPQQSVSLPQSGQMGAQQGQQVGFGPQGQQGGFGQQDQGQQGQGGFNQQVQPGAPGNPNAGKSKTSKEPSESSPAKIWKIATGVLAALLVALTVLLVLTIQKNKEDTSTLSEGPQTQVTDPATVNTDDPAPVPSRGDSKPPAQTSTDEDGNIVDGAPDEVIPYDLSEFLQPMYLSTGLVDDAEALSSKTKNGVTVTIAKVYTPGSDTSSIIALFTNTSDDQLSFVPSTATFSLTATDGDLATYTPATNPFSSAEAGVETQPFLAGADLDSSIGWEVGETFQLAIGFPIDSFQYFDWTADFGLGETGSPVVTTVSGSGGLT